MQVAKDLPTAIAKLATRIGAAKRPLCITGSGSRQEFGENLPRTTKLDVSSLDGISVHEPSELYVRVGAGTTLGQLRETLAAQGQQLAGDHTGSAKATIGGTLACGIDGPYKPSRGRMRDHLLGCKLINGEGKILNFGGNLIKNVAGFDLSRLQVGALGTLGVLAEVSLRVTGKEEKVATLASDCSAHEALQQTNVLVARGVPVSASTWHEGRLLLRLAGSTAAMNHALMEISGTEMEDAEQSVWQPLRELRWKQLGKPGPIWLCHVPTMTELSCDDLALIEWHGQRRWFFEDAPEDLRAKVASAGGSAILWQRGPGQDDVPVFPTMPDRLVQLHTRLKAAFDPRGILNPGKHGYA